MSKKIHKSIKLSKLKKPRKTRYMILIFLILPFVIFYFLLVNPIIFWVEKKILDFEVSETFLKEHVNFLVNLDKQRTYLNLEALDTTVSYIEEYFKKSWCDKVYLQPYKINNTEYKNVICYFNWIKPEKIIIWAHYDVYGEESNEWEKFEWADDNASWIAWILELSRLVWLNKDKIKNSLELVAYTLEEPPFYNSDKMWSYVHAKSLFDNDEKIKYMIALEMIWYFSDENIQKYPINFLSRFYPDTWNFIAVIWQLFDFEIKNIKKSMLMYSGIDIKSLSAPRWVVWIDFSDHRNYWEFWYKAYMITDTSFYRNPNYHTVGDTIETLDFSKMKEVVSSVYWILID